MSLIPRSWNTGPTEISPRRSCAATRAPDSAQVLEADVEQLTDLSELVRRQADLLTGAHGTMEDTRRRWRRARRELRTEVDSINKAAERERRRAERERDGKGGRDEGGPHDADANDDGRDIEPPTEAGQLIKAMDQQVLDQFEGPTRRPGVHRPARRDGDDERQVEQAAERYRQSVHAIIEELVEALPRHEKTLLSSISFADGDAAPDPLCLSRPDDIAPVGEGRMTPEDEAQGSISGFQRTWTQHFDEIREDFNHARKADRDIATRLRELDERGAREMRRSSRTG
jgi:hypothetical protein